MKRKCKHCQLIDLINELNCQGKPIPRKVLIALANLKCNKLKKSLEPVIGPYL